MLGWQFTLICSVEAINFPKVTMIKSGFNFQQWRTETHGESSHQENASFLACFYYSPCVFKSCRNGFFAEYVNSMGGSHFYKRAMTIVFRADDHSIRFGIQQVIVSMEILR